LDANDAAPSAAAEAAPATTRTVRVVSAAVGFTTKLAVEGEVTAKDPGAKVQFTMARPLAEKPVTGALQDTCTAMVALAVGLDAVVLSEGTGPAARREEERRG
jgi:spore coat protein U-like protein